MILTPKYTIWSMQGLGQSGDKKYLIMEADVRYTKLQHLCGIILVIPVTTASVERSFSSMNRVLTKKRKKCSQEP